MKSDANKGPAPSVSKRPPSAEPPNSDIAPWMNESLPAISTHGLTSGNFFNDAHSKLQTSPSFRPDTGRTGDSESPDTLTFGDERRPSMASATTVSSQNSVSKASTNRSNTHKKIAGFFTDDGRQSSRSSDTSIPSTLQREQSSSRHNSIPISQTDSRAPTSPTNSRPRTPLPSSEVTPWLFQDFKVSSYVWSGAFAVSMSLL